MLLIILIQIFIPLSDANNLFFIFVQSTCCMSTKAEKPVLQGQRIKTRKRDERAKFDPIGFRDSILQVSYCLTLMQIISFIL